MVYGEVLNEIRNQQTANWTNSTAKWCCEKILKEKSKIFAKYFHGNKFYLGISIFPSYLKFTNVTPALQRNQELWKITLLRNLY